MPFDISSSNLRCLTIGKRLRFKSEKCSCRLQSGNSKKSIRIFFAIPVFNHHFSNCVFPRNPISYPRSLATSESAGLISVQRVSDIFWPLFLISDTPSYHSPSDKKIRSVVGAGFAVGATCALFTKYLRMRDRREFLFYELTVMSCFPYLAFTIAEGV